MNEAVSRSFLGLAGYGAISLVLLVLGGWLTFIGLGDWYYGLDFPPFQPAPGLFTPAWVVVLTCLALATWLVAGFVEQRGAAVALCLALYGAQCVLNAGWSLLFFTVQRPDVALWELYVLDLVLLAMVWAYGRVSAWAALLLAPYAGWLALSTAINWWIVRYNTFPLPGGAL